MFPLLQTLLLIAALAVTKSDPADGDRGFARLTALAGNWLVTQGGHTSNATFTPEVGGSVVVQKSGFMLVFHRDGAAIRATLFTAEGNQSRLISKGIAKGAKTLHFDFVDSSNVQPGAIFAHGLEIDFESTDLVVERWRFQQADKETNLTIVYRRAQK